MVVDHNQKGRGARIDRRVAWGQFAILMRRELRSPGLWVLAAVSISFGSLNARPRPAGMPGAEGLLTLEVGPLSFSSWDGLLLAVMCVILPVWIIERVTLDHRSQWFDPLFVGGWKRERYLLYQWSVVAGLGTGVFLAALASGGAASMLFGVPMPTDIPEIVAIAMPTLLAASAGGLLLATLFRERGIALSAGLLGIALPMAVSAYFVLRLDRHPPDALRLFLSLHLPPLGQNPGAVHLFHKLAYASVTLWLSLFLGERLIGRRP